eukprot:Sdes_comp17582_c0_seq1m6829
MMALEGNFFRVEIEADEGRDRIFQRFVDFDQIRREKIQTLKKKEFLSCLFGETHSGKTCFAFQYCLNAAKQGYQIFYIAFSKKKFSQKIPPPLELCSVEEDSEYMKNIRIFYADNYSKLLFLISNFHTLNVSNIPFLVVIDEFSLYSASNSTSFQ